MDWRQVKSAARVSGSGALAQAGIMVFSKHKPGYRL